MNEAPLMGGIALVLAAILVWRGVRAIRTGTVPLYRRRAGRDALGPARFWFAVGLQFLVALVLLVVASGVFLNLGLRPR